MNTLDRLLFWAVIAWTAVIGSSLYWNFFQSERQMLDLVRNEALANFNKDQAFRLWATKHGGVYVPATETTPPSSYLAHIPERDIVTPSGLHLTLLNPNYMVRELSEFYEQLYGVKGHITGLRQLRPENFPDPWEETALNRFETGTKEVTEITSIGNQPFFRLIRPMVMEEGCLKCHGHLGFKVGDIRGGVGVAVPMKPYLDAKTRQNKVLFGSHGAIWLLGLSIIGMGRRKIRHNVSETEGARKELAELNADLERRIDERTNAFFEQKERLRMMLSSAADGIITIDDKGIIESFNDVASTMFGYSQGEALGMPVSMLMPEPNASSHQIYVERYLATRQTRIIGVGREVEARRSDGTIFPVHLAISALHMGDKAIFTAIMRDMTSEKQAAGELMAAKELAEAARRQAERANRAKSEFLASMSHELRTPLNGILGYAQILQIPSESKLSARHEEYVGNIVSAGRHLVELINEILDLAKIESGGLTLKIEPINLPNIIDESLSIIEHLAVNNQITILDELGKSPDLPYLKADYVRLKQVLANLLTNAIKYNRSQGSVRLSGGIENSEIFWIEVTDTGLGMSKLQLEELFQPFNRLGHETGSIEGSGIGLSITKKLVEAMDGRIEVESQENIGSTFRIYLPISLASENEEAATISWRPQSKAKSILDTGQRKVL
jgi:PAS domain S-box-containing protein